MRLWTRIRLLFCKPVEIPRGIPYEQISLEVRRLKNKIYVTKIYELK